mmetsp:Transcript_40416/g.72854  ORF Transcript_40416/g.72854 Transcript_40416/m.72854 type:complete len:486 (-) Transcript_40416:378-1835(-)
MMVPSMAKKRAAPVVGAAEVPIFLQKAYHMIDTCDPKVCSWSEDGLTFIVKNTPLFETTIIPQFFKHNKFSSFVRQLNFYGFRKVKFSNSLKIDHKLEAETAKFWRFRHDKFRRGRKDLLTEIKRTPSSAATSTSSSPPSVNKAIVPRVATSSLVVSTMQPLKQKLNDKPGEVTHLKTEMQELKQRIASMTKNIDELTDLVMKVSVNDEEGPSPLVSPNAAKLVEPEGFGLRNKRKKMESVEIKQEDVIMDDLPIMPDWNPSSSDLASVDSLLLGDHPLPDLATSGALSPIAPSPSPALSDDTFVDDLFQAFADEDAIIPGMERMEEAEEKKNNSNKPCPQLMKRIEDSLSTIPREMHEMVANRLIDAISDTQPIAKAASCLFPSQNCSSEKETIRTDRSISVDEGSVSMMQPQAISQNDQTAMEGANNGSTVATSIPLPLAVATLKTILAEYGVSVECRRTPCKNAALERTRFTKSLPVVPMHA